MNTDHNTRILCISTIAKGLLARDCYMQRPSKGSLDPRYLMHDNGANWKKFGYPARKSTRAVLDAIKIFKEIEDTIALLP